MALVHVAMSDAVNSVKERFARYSSAAALMPNASAEAAAASAARKVLKELFPAQTAGIDAAYVASIKSIAEGDSKAQGVALGEQVAAAILAERGRPMARLRLTPIAP